MVQVIGHRGVAGLEPENTLRSFRRAIELGVDYVECDVRLTADRMLVLMHDETVDRTTNGSGPVAQMVFADLRRLDAGGGEQVPTLEEFLDLIHGQVKAHVELKGDGTEDVVLPFLEYKGAFDDVVLTSGDTQKLRRVRAKHGTVTIEHIFGQPPPDAIQRAQSVKAKRISTHYSHATAAYIEAAHRAFLEVIAWPPNTEATMQAMIDLGVDYICSDRPDILLRLLGRHQPGMV